MGRGEGDGERAGFGVGRPVAPVPGVARRTPPACVSRPDAGRPHRGRGWRTTGSRRSTPRSRTWATLPTWSRGWRTRGRSRTARGRASTTSPPPTSTSCSRHSSPRPRRLSPRWPGRWPTWALAASEYLGMAQRVNALKGTNPTRRHRASPPSTCERPCADGRAVRHPAAADGASTSLAGPTGASAAVRARSGHRRPARRPGPDRARMERRRPFPATDTPPPPDDDGTPDFDGGARETPPEPENPEGDHGELVKNLLAPRDGGPWLG